MEISTDIDKTLNLRIHTVTGALTREDLFAFLTEVYSRPDFDPSMNILWDFTDSDLGPLLLPDVVTIRDFVEKRLGTFKTIRFALVVSNEFNFGLATMFATLLTSAGIYAKVFRGYEEARKWATS